MRIAVIPATYNRPEALAALLEGYLAQDYPDFEIVVADDGSGPQTQEVIRRYQARARFRIGHVWQENRGYRAAAIRNRAVACTDADYIVFTDQDCVPLPDFLSRHARLAEPGWFVSGNRVLTTERFAQRILAEKLPIHAWTLPQWLRCRLRGDINRVHPLLRLPDGRFRKLHPRRWQGARTANLAVWRRDLVKVNGMDEGYSGWGLEDSDLVIRLIRAGVLHKSGRYACPVIHLWHPEQDRSRLPQNRQRLEEILSSPRIEARSGLLQYL
ncbi:MAG TPA: glycosyltransferase family 2 protein [Burkholderiales bacterium]|nr:glycosyltransferase family 2 protein [Burkholderiales bacterium]